MQASSALLNELRSVAKRKRHNRMQSPSLLRPYHFSQAAVSRWNCFRKITRSSVTLVAHYLQRDYATFGAPFSLKAWSCMHLCKSLMRHGNKGAWLLFRSLLLSTRTRVVPLTGTYIQPLQDAPQRMSFTETPNCSCLCNGFSL